MKSTTRLRFLFLLPVIALYTFASCAKDPEIIIKTEVVTITDTIIVVDTVTVLETIFETVPDTATTFILVRHAETTGIGSNPALSNAGQSRANELQRILDNVPLDAVYSTNYNRTMQTASPTATSKGLAILNYDPSALDTFVDNTLAQLHEGIVLVVGHSNTTPALLNTLIGATTYSDLPESAYDNLFLVYVSEKGRATVVHMKYGE